MTVKKRVKYALGFSLAVLSGIAACLLFSFSSLPQMLFMLLQLGLFLLLLAAFAVGLAAMWNNTKWY